MKVLLAGLFPLAWACSYVEIPFPSAAENGSSYMIGRTMELSNIADRTSYVIESVPAQTSGGKYAFVAPFNVFHFAPLPSQKVAFEGMNEAGFTASALALEESVYEDEQEGASERDADKPAVFYGDVVRQLLMHCDSVEVALGFLAAIRVVRGGGAMRSMLEKQGLHWALADASGRSVVVEYLQGRRVVSENAPRVMTNDPNLEWQWRNLNTHVNLSPHFPSQNDFLQVELGSSFGRVPRAVGHGWNLQGLPGDSSPPSRFVRLFYLRGYALRASAPANDADAIVLGTALLNNVFIPFGTVAADPVPPGLDRPEFTPYGILKSPSQKRMLVRGYRNTQWRQIDLTKLDLTTAQAWPLEDGTLGISDITGKGSSISAASEGSFGDRAATTVI